MVKTLTAQGNYSAPSGEVITFDFDYLVIDSVADAIAELGEDKVKSAIQRMFKLDAANTAREKAKVANGHSTRKPMTEEEKAKAKAQRQADKALLDAIRAKGLTAEEIANL